ncbi:hypothetical protein E2C01_034804 [Portunus trituberculatus]|uniref:Uncharacterized protein n=1 Tax=Portunus trituberculatus TaxID=210409 RepID=A0A5B7F6N7_PORTR|nr:hypothetical protein [Portunus trituberculatus]
MTNSFIVLEGVEEERERDKAGDDEMKRSYDSLPADKILVVGDSHVRHLDSSFCAKYRKQRTKVCLPGAGIERISAQLDTRLADGTKPIVFFSTGGSDFCKVKIEELFRRFKEVLAKVGNKDATPVVCSVLPRRGLFRTIAVNYRLADHCRSNGWAFIDNWDLFLRQRHLVCQGWSAFITPRCSCFGWNT